MVNIVSAGHVFVQQHTHPTYHALRSLDQQMFLCYSQPGTPALPSPPEGLCMCMCARVCVWPVCMCLACVYVFGLCVRMLTAVRLLRSRGDLRSSGC